MNKLYDTCEAVLSDIHSGDTIMVGGFEGRGVPSALLRALKKKNLSNLTIIRNDASGGWKNPDDVNILIETGQVKKVITCWAVFGSPKKISALEQKVLEGVTELELVPQGTLAERIRAGGSGVGAFYVPVGVGTVAAEGKDLRIINDQEMILEYALRAKFALIKAHQADVYGNLSYRKTARNFNPIMAMAADITIVETEQMLPVGDIDIDRIQTPCVYVNRIVHVPRSDK